MNETAIVLDRLKSWEDPANTSAVAVTYRAMLAAATATHLADAQRPRWANGQVAELSPAQAVRRTGKTQGRIATYMDGCRCGECREAAALKQRLYRERIRAAS